MTASPPAANLAIEQPGTGGPFATRWHTAGAWATWLTLPVACLIVALSFSYAATHRGDKLHYHLFWLGVLVFFAPATLRLLSGATATAERYALVVAVGVFSYLPKFLRDPRYPLLSDELTHWRQAEVVYRTGHLMRPNPILHIVQFFPGLSALTASLRTLAGVPTYRIAVVVVALVHAVTLLGVFAVIQRVTGSMRAAGLGALVYSVNPGFMYTDAQYAYETLAISLFVWTIVGAVMVVTERDNRLRAGWLSVGILMAAAATVTHHLTSYVTALVLMLLAIIAFIRRDETHRPRQGVIPLFALAAGAAVVAAAWAVFVAPQVFGYLFSPLGTAIKELAHISVGKGGARRLFANSDVPDYERILAFASPLVAGVAAVLAVRHLYRTRRLDSVTIGMTFVALAYFAFQPFVFSSAGVVVGHRIRTFSYLGLAVIIAPAAIDGLNRLRSSGPARRSLGVAALTTAAFVVLVGNVAAARTTFERFPGPFRYGVEGRILTPELLGTTNWFRNTFGAGQRVIADRFTAPSLAAFGRAWTASPAALPVWELYFRAGLPDRSVLNRLCAGRWEYLVIDRRMSRTVPLLRWYFVRHEPQGGTRQTPPPSVAIDKYNNLPFTTKVFSSDNLEIYRLDYDRLAHRLSCGQ